MNEQNIVHSNLITRILPILQRCAYKFVSFYPLVVKFWGTGSDAIGDVVPMLQTAVVSVIPVQCDAIDAEGLRKASVSGTAAALTPLKTQTSTSPQQFQYDTAATGSFPAPASASPVAAVPATQISSSSKTLASIRKSSRKTRGDSAAAAAGVATVSAAAPAAARSNGHSELAKTKSDNPSRAKSKMCAISWILILKIAVKFRFSLLSQKKIYGSLLLPLL